MKLLKLYAEYVIPSRTEPLAGATWGEPDLHAAARAMPVGVLVSIRARSEAIKRVEPWTLVKIRDDEPMLVARRLTWWMRLVTWWLNVGRRRRRRVWLKARALYFSEGQVMARKRASR